MRDRKSLIPRLLLAGAASMYLAPAYAQDSEIVEQIPQICQGIEDRLLQLSGGEPVGDYELELGKIEDEAKGGVVYTSFDNTGIPFDQFKDCLAKLGMPIADGISGNNVSSFGIDVKIGPKCFEELEIYSNTAFPESANWGYDWHELPFQGEQKICFGFPYKLK